MTSWGIKIANIAEKYTPANAGQCTGIPKERILLTHLMQTWLSNAPTF